jgi:hypothetical protein
MRFVALASAMTLAACSPAPHKADAPQPQTLESLA